VLTIAIFPCWAVAHSGPSQQDTCPAFLSVHALCCMRKVLLGVRNATESVGICIAITGHHEWPYCRCAQYYYDFRRHVSVSQLFVSVPSTLARVGGDGELLLGVAGQASRAATALEPCAELPGRGSCRAMPIPDGMCACMSGYWNPDVCSTVEVAILCTISGHFTHVHIHACGMYPCVRVRAHVETGGLPGFYL